MIDSGPLRGMDLSEKLRRRNFGVTTGEAADAVPTVELNTALDLYGDHGRVHVRCTATITRSPSTPGDPPVELAW